MKRMTLVLAAAMSLTCAGTALADDIVSWVDAKGRVHFTSAHLAPAESRDQFVEVEHTNSMDVPGQIAPNTSTDRPSVAKMYLPERQLKPRLTGYSRRARHSW
ncbi:MAG: hypothetical protein O3A63_13595 [Proteobacteria bacterium]|nr:hypothetical protein [Pseudomonadota bacterium]